LRETPFFKESQESVYLEDELSFIKAIDAKSIKNWDDFEYILSVIVENRIIKVFVAH
jgi:hypothetical protein